MCMHDKHACEFIYEMDHVCVCVRDGTLMLLMSVCMCMCVCA